jgi:DNA repair exonuclease SbcCD ATPase subunit
VIIEQLHAENVFKFVRLELDNLPRKGLIAVTGANESGKTAILETICFALFGRTFSLQGPELTELIHWGENRCSATLQFSGRDGASYWVTRFLDSAGKQGARLHRSDTGEILARGTAAVQESVLQKCGFDYGELLDSVYLLEEEAGAPSAPAATVKTLAGVAAMERVALEIRGEIQTHREQIGEVEEQIAQTRRQIQELGVEELTLERLEANEQELLEGIADAEVRLAGIEQAVAGLGQEMARFRQAVGELIANDQDGPAERWLARLANAEKALESVDRAALCVAGDQSAGPGAEIRVQIGALRANWAAFEDLRSQAVVQRKRLESLLSAQETEPSAQSEHEDEEPVPDSAEQAPGLLAQARHVETKLTATALRRGRARTALAIVLALGALAWLAWGLVSRPPETFAGSELVQWLTTQFPAVEIAVQQRWLLGCAILTSALSLVFLYRARALGSVVRRLDGQKTALANEIEALRNRVARLQGVEGLWVRDVVTTLIETGDEEAQAVTRAFSEGVGRTLVDEQAWSELRQTIQEAAQRYEERTAELRNRAEQAAAAIRGELTALRGEVTASGEQISAETERRDAARHLTETLAAFDGEIDTHRHEIAIREAALSLLSGVTRQRAERFSADLRSFVGRIMPLLTEQRYQHLHLGEELEVSVFSNEKHDFVRLSELSTGTQRQILLALRLALAEGLSEANGGEPGQCILLDEPFAFYDQQRLQATLNALPQISERLSQFWIIAQQLPAEASFARHVRCERDNDQLGSA